MTTPILERDREVLSTLAPRLEALWKPLRFLSDLEKIWPDLSKEEREEIVESRPYRDQIHRRLAESRVTDLLRMLDDVHAPKHRELREELRLFLAHWEHQEPDRVKVLSALVRQAAE